MSFMSHRNKALAKLIWTVILRIFFKSFEIIQNEKRALSFYLYFIWEIILPAGKRINFFCPQIALCRPCENRISSVNIYFCLKRKRSVVYIGNLFIPYQSVKCGNRRKASNKNLSQKYGKTLFRNFQMIFSSGYKITAGNLITGHFKSPLIL